MELYRTSQSGGNGGQLPYDPESEPNYPVFDVSLQAPLPAHDVFISSLYSFVAPPLVGVFVAFVGIAIYKSVMNSFNKK